MQLLESLVYEEQLESEIDETSGYDAAIESMMLLEGLGSKDIPDEYRKEAMKSFAAICKYAKADTVSSNAKALVKADKKLSKISRVYAMPGIQCADGIVAEDVALKFKSLGYKKGVNRDVTKKNAVTYFFLKPIGSDGYINPIVSVYEKGSKLGKGKIFVTFSYAFKDKVTDDQLKLFK